jgi:hypothetical protein
LRAHKHGTLKWYDYRISTGPSEAATDKIKTIKLQAYGFWDRAFITIKIYALHLTKCAPWRGNAKVYVLRFNYMTC